MLFVGTKRQAADTIEREAHRCGMPFVSDRWLGGTLTNFRTIRSRLGRLEELESHAQRRRIGHVFEEDAVGLGPRISQDVSQPQRHADDEPPARVPGGHRSAEGKERRQGSPKLGITTVALIDTDCDPDTVDLPIPGNDDSIRSIELIVQQLADAVLEGKTKPSTAKQERTRRRLAEQPGVADADARGDCAASTVAGAALGAADGLACERSLSDASGGSPRCARRQLDTDRKYLEEI